MQVIGIAGVTFILGACVAFVISEAIRTDRERGRERLHVATYEGADGTYRWEGFIDDEPVVGGRIAGRSSEAHAYAAARRVRDSRWEFPPELANVDFTSLPRG